MDTPNTRGDRRTVDGESGSGDMLGGLTTGAGGQLGLPEGEPSGEDRVLIIPAESTEEADAASETDTASTNRDASDSA